MQNQIKNKSNSFFLEYGKKKQDSVVKEMCECSGPDGEGFFPAQPQDYSTQKRVQNGQHAKITVGHGENDHRGAFN